VLHSGSAAPELKRHLAPRGLAHRRTVGPAAPADGIELSADEHRRGCARHGRHAGVTQYFADTLPVLRGIAMFSCATLVVGDLAVRRLGFLRVASLVLVSF
jgi:hypothetical protein